MILLICCFWVLAQSTRNSLESYEKNQEDVFVENITEAEETSEYELINIEMTSEEREAITDKLHIVAKKCNSIYARANKGDASNVVLEEEAVHQMIECVADDGHSIGCGGNDYNMNNYESVHDKLTQAKNGEDTEVEFYIINSSAIIGYYYLQFISGDLFVTFGSATYDDDMEIVVTYMEKIQVYQWEYTDKGWMIWEKSLSRNEEMDMHVFHRILPLEGRCRELGSKCILPISYFCNNLFLIDWDDKNIQDIEFNDLYEFLYAMDNGNSFDEDEHLNGIPKEEFEDLVQKYFDISKDDLKKCARYNQDKGTYPWSAIGYWNRIQQFQPFPEVVKCVENEDGTISVYVDAVFVEKGDDCSFSHVVTIQENEDGSWKYCGNKIDMENAKHIPGYIPRREYLENN